jgi:hypothetical protein
VGLPRDNSIEGVGGNILRYYEGRSTINLDCSLLAFYGTVSILFCIGLIRRPGRVDAVGEVAGYGPTSGSLWRLGCRCSEGFKVTWPLILHSN